MSHSTYVQKIGPGGFFAVCSRCGSDPFPNRRRLAEAEGDAEAHGRLNHIYDRNELLAHEALDHNAPPEPDSGEGSKPNQVPNQGDR